MDDPATRAQRAFVAGARWALRVGDDLDERRMREVAAAWESLDRSTSGLRGATLRRQRHGDRFGRRLTPDREAAVRRALHLRAQGLSLSKVAAALNYEGVPTLTGRPWSIGAVHQVTTNLTARRLMAADTG